MKNGNIIAVWENEPYAYTHNGIALDTDDPYKLVMRPPVEYEYWNILKGNRVESFKTLNDAKEYTNDGFHGLLCRMRVQLINGVPTNPTII